jgi:hypothetical protein
MIETLVVRRMTPIELLGSLATMVPMIGEMLHSGYLNQPRRRSMDPETSSFLRQIAASTIGVATVGAGFWRFVFKQQIDALNTALKSKETEKEALQARIQHLEGIAAPILAAQNKAMAELIERSAREAHALRARLVEMEKAQEGGTQEYVKMKNSVLARGLFEGAIVIREMAKQILPSDPLLMSGERSALLTALMGARERLMQLARETANGKNPELPSDERLAKAERSNSLGPPSGAP